MEYLFVMSLSGSTMMGIYLIPLPFLKERYRKIIRAFVPERQINSVQIPVKWTNNVIRVGSKVYVNNYAIVQTIVAGIWLLTASILMVRWILKYVRIRRQIVKYTGAVMTERQKSFLEEVKKQYGVR